MPQATKAIREQLEPQTSTENTQTPVTHLSGVFGVFTGEAPPAVIMDAPAVIRDAAAIDLLVVNRSRSLRIPAN